MRVLGRSLYRKLKKELSFGERWRDSYSVVKGEFPDEMGAPHCLTCSCTWAWSARSNTVKALPFKVKKAFIPAAGGGQRWSRPSGRRTRRPSGSVRRCGTCR